MGTVRNYQCPWCRRKDFSLRNGRTSEAVVDLFGASTFFNTPNFADSIRSAAQPVSAVLLSQCHLSIRSAAQPAVSEIIRAEPKMLSLERMHQICAKDPRAQAKFFILVTELHYRFIIGLDRLHIGRLTLAQPRVPVHDAFGLELRCYGPCVAPGTIDVQAPFEAQGRGFEHGHGKGPRDITIDDSGDAWQPSGASQPAEEDTNVALVPLPLAMRGCTEEQIDAVSLLALSLQKRFDTRPDKKTHFLPVATPFNNHRAVWLGGGGVGKSRTLTQVVEPLCVTYFGSNGYAAAAQANQAAHGEPDQNRQQQRDFDEGGGYKKKQSKNSRWARHMQIEMGSKQLWEVVSFTGNSDSTLHPQ
jgi:hypothetical protein